MSYKDELTVDKKKKKKKKRRKSNSNDALTVFIVLFIFSIITPFMKILLAYL